MNLARNTSVFDCPLLVMANSQNLVARVKGYLGVGCLNSMVDLRSVLSSPRLTDVFVRKLNSTQLAVVGDSFLSKHTALGDWRHKTYGMSLRAWDEVQRTVEVVESFPFGDLSVSRLQIWPFDPHELSLEAMKLAVAVSYHDMELIYEPRIFGAINELLAEYNIEADPEA